MASSQFLYSSLLFLFIGVASSSSIFYNALESRGSPACSLLQIKKVGLEALPHLEDMESKNYTILTSQCKGPQFPAKACCGALKEFACPFADAINDATTDCASTMFSYINLYGNYPPGLFANQCKEGKEGLSCDEIAASVKSETQPRTGLLSAPRSHLLILVPIFLVTLMQFF